MHRSRYIRETRHRSAGRSSRDISAVKVGRNRNCNRLSLRKSKVACELLTPETHSSRLENVRVHPRLTLRRSRCSFARTRIAQTEITPPRREGETVRDSRNFHRIEAQNRLPLMKAYIRAAGAIWALTFAQTRMARRAARSSTRLTSLPHQNGNYY